MSTDAKKVKKAIEPNKERRVDTVPIKVYCTKTQREAIVINASLARLSLSTYLLRMGTQPVPNVHANKKEDVKNLLKINADLGRLGGLIKLWLTNDERTRLIGEPKLRATLDEIVSTQIKMVDAINAFKKFN